MASVFLSDKNFKIIKADRAEMMAIGSYAVCDQCNSSPDDGFLIAVLSQWVCPECYESWHAQAKYYPEDAEYETRIFQRYSDILLGVRPNR